MWKGSEAKLVDEDEGIGDMKHENGTRGEESEEAAMKRASRRRIIVVGGRKLRI